MLAGRRIHARLSHPSAQRDEMTLDVDVAHLLDGIPRRPAKIGGEVAAQFLPKPPSTCCAGVSRHQHQSAPARITSFGRGGGGKQSAGSSAQIVQIHASDLGGLSQP